MQPVVGWPRHAQVGRRYLVEVDLKPLGGPDSWPSDREEIAIHCLLRAAPLFTSRPVGEPTLVVHRFGGTYGPVRFVLTAADQAGQGDLEVTLINEEGVAMTRIPLPGVEVVEAVETEPDAEPSAFMVQEEAPASVETAEEPKETESAQWDRARNADEIQSRLLPATTCKLYVAGGGRTGSGFFVAPGTVVTCKHVLEPLDLQHEGAPARIDVRDLSGSEYKVVAVRHVSDDVDDLAVLRVEPGDPHPSALLASGLNAGDEVAAFGYTAKYEEGVPVTFIGEGVMGDQKLFKLGQGAVEPGMSGAPLLNLRTGAVCGILKRTRDARQTIGGYAIPITTLLALSDSIITGNRAYHTAHPEWLDLVPEATSQAWRGARASEPDGGPPHRTLVVTFSERAETLEVVARVEPGVTEAPVRVDLNAMRRELFRIVAGAGELPPVERLRTLGQILLRILFPGELAELFDALLDDLDADRARRLSVVVLLDDAEDSDLFELPWEQTYASASRDRGDRYLARDSGFTFARGLRHVIEAAPSPHRVAMADVLLVPGIRPNGSDDWSESGHDVESAVADLFATLTASGARVTTLSSPTQSTLADAVARGGYGIVHYIGVGRLDAGEEELALARRFVTARDFAACLEPAPRLVVVQNCARDLGPSPDLVPPRLARTAATILRRGADAAVVTQAPTRFAESAEFNRRMYATLLIGGALQVAVQRARKDLYMKWPNLAAWAETALFVRSPHDIHLAPLRESSSPYGVGPFSGHG
jgi:hypothetical protein